MNAQGGVAGPGGGPHLDRLANASPSRGAFTLLEVLLAIVIAVGLMVVAVYFYQQLGRLRSDSVREMEKLSTLRLLMDKLAADLRCAHSLGYFDSGFSGGADFIQFVKAEVPALSDWTDDVSLAQVPPESDLKRIGYTLVVSVNDTNQTGSLMRWEEPNWPASPIPTENSGEGGAPFLEVDFAAASRGSVEATNLMDSGTTIMLDQVQYLRFRYFDGTEWRSTWDGLGLPVGVEVSMSPEVFASSDQSVPPARDAESESESESEVSVRVDWNEPVELEEDYPETLFRRVIAIPSSGADLESPEDLSWLGDVSEPSTNGVFESGTTGEESTP